MLRLMVDRRRVCACMFHRVLQSQWPDIKLIDNNLCEDTRLLSCQCQSGTTIVLFQFPFHSN